MSVAAGKLEDGGFDNKPGFRYRGDANAERHLNGPSRFPPRRGNIPGTIGSPRLLSDHVTVSSRRRRHSPSFPFYCSCFLFTAAVGQRERVGELDRAAKGTFRTTGSGGSSGVQCDCDLSLPPSA